MKIEIEKIEAHVGLNLREIITIQSALSALENTDTCRDTGMAPDFWVLVDKINNCKKFITEEKDVK
jgi:hypothetical protein